MATFQVSPGVNVQEIDATNTIPAVSTSIGGTAIVADWGPINEVTLFSLEKDLVKLHGKPTAFTSESFFNSTQFLAFGAALKVVRAKSDSTNSNVVGATTTLVENKQEYLDGLYDGTGFAVNGAWLARYAGIKGDSITIEVCPADSTLFDGWAYKGLFDTTPSTSQFAVDNSITLDEMHIVVIDTGGALSGVPGSILEKFAYVSQLSDAKTGDGTNNYYRDVIASTSQYIYWTGHHTELTNAGVTGDGFSGAMDVGVSVLSDSLTGGQADTSVTLGDIQNAVDLLSNPESEDVNLMICPPLDDDADGITLANYVTAACILRKDCIAFISPPLEATVGTATPSTDVITFADALTSTSYGTVDSSAVRVYDRYNDVYRWVPASGNHAGLYAFTDQVADSWFSGAGLNRGFLRGVSKIAFNPTQDDRDALYKARVNPIISSPGQGIVMFGDKTLLSKPSAFSRINVRRLFIVLEKAISTAAKFQLFEINDEFTRSIFRNQVEPFLRNVEGRRGVEEFKVVCDSTNNDGAVIAANSFVADIFIKPPQSINFITLNFVAVRSGVDFNEIAG